MLYNIVSVMSFFYKNLKKYQPYEVIASELIKEKYNVDVLSFCNDNRYDFEMSNNMKCEVKTEPASLKTFNFFIEIFAYGKPSGLSITEATYYIFCDTISYYMISTEKLKELVKLHGILKKTKDGLTHGYIISCDIIHDDAIKLK